MMERRAKVRQGRRLGDPGRLGPAWPCSEGSDPRPGRGKGISKPDGFPCTHAVRGRRSARFTGAVQQCCPDLSDTLRERTEPVPAVDKAFRLIQRSGDKHRWLCPAHHAEFRKAPTRRGS